MYENLEVFGETIAEDGKAIQSYATKISGKTVETEEKEMQTGIKRNIQ